MHVCGKPLSPEDRKVWRQAIALLIGLQRKNSFGEEDLTAAVGAALHRATKSGNCEDCGVMVASVAAVAEGVPRGSERSPWAGDACTRPGAQIIS
jgi:hypothetical protein